MNLTAARSITSRTISYIMGEGVVRRISSIFPAKLQPTSCGHSLLPTLDFPEVLHTLNRVGSAYTLPSTNVSKGGETAAENTNAAVNTKEAAVDRTAAMDEAAAVDKTAAADMDAAEDASPAYHGIATAVAHCGMPIDPASLITTFGASA